jgi:hypothetical protein
MLQRSNSWVEWKKQVDILFYDVLPCTSSWIQAHYSPSTLILPQKLSEQQLPGPPPLIRCEALYHNEWDKKFENKLTQLRIELTELSTSPKTKAEFAVFQWLLVDAFARYMFPFLPSVKSKL